MPACPSLVPVVTMILSKMACGNNGVMSFHLLTVDR